MNSQFVHGETYARRGYRGKPSVRAVLAEAAREPGHHPHVVDSQPPTVVFGLTLTEVQTIHDNRTGIATDRGVRALPRSFPSLLGLVASLPVKPSEMVDPDVNAAVAEWLDKTIAFFQAEFGESLLSVLVHTDEPFYHAHAFCVPVLDPLTDAMSLETIWKPMSAQGAARRAAAAAERANGAAEPSAGEVEQAEGEPAQTTGGTKKKKGIRAIQRDAYKLAAKEFQDRYHEAVGDALGGLLRVGPDRPRLRRGDYLAAKRRREEAERQEADRKEALDRREADIDRRETDLNERLAAIELRQSAVDSLVEARVASRLTEIKQNFARRIDQMQTLAANRIEQERAARRDVEEKLEHALAEVSNLRDALSETGFDPHPAAQPF
jgi:hypothetical protein